MTRLRGVSQLVSITALMFAGCGDDGGSRPGGDGGNGSNGGDSGSSGPTNGSDSGSGGDDGGPGSGSGGTGSGTGGDSGSGSGTATGDSGSGTGDSGSGTGDSGSGTGSGTGSVGSGSSTSASIVPCDTASATLEPIPPNIYLVLDKSGSMVQNQWDHDGMPATPTQTRWYGLYDVVEFVLNAFDAQINFGTVLFPRLGSGMMGSCEVSGTANVPVGPMNAATILSTIPDRMADDTVIGGATPTRKGLMVAYDDLRAQTGNNPPAVVLVTDGAANCPGTGNSFVEWNMYDDTLLPIVQDAWNTDQIPTYVIGIDISTMNTGDNGGLPDGTPDNIVPFDKMDELAQNGGRPNPNGPPAFYDTTNGAELQAALQQIIDDSLSCVVDLNPAAPFPNLIEIEIDGMTVPMVTDCATENGWIWTNSPDQIELCGTACDDLLNFGNLDAKYFCEPG